MNRLRVCLACLAAASIAGCGGNTHTDLQQFVNDVDARPAPPIEPIPEIQPYVPYRYTPGGRRAIFTPAEPERQASNNGIRPDRNRPLEALEQFSLGELHVVGVLRMNGRTQALVQAPDGVIHRVIRGDHMGQNFGQVTAIDSGQISLVEIVPDGNGGYIKRTADLAASSDSRS